MALMKKRAIWVLLFVAGTLLSAEDISRGIMDLSSWEGKDSVKLNGEWEFYCRNS